MGFPVVSAFLVISFGVPAVTLKLSLGITKLSLNTPPEILRQSAQWQRAWDPPDQKKNRKTNVNVCSVTRSAWHAHTNTHRGEGNSPPLRAHRSTRT